MCIRDRLYATADQSVDGRTIDAPISNISKKLSKAGANFGIKAEAGYGIGWTFDAKTTRQIDYGSNGFEFMSDGTVFLHGQQLKCKNFLTGQKIPLRRTLQNLLCAVIDSYDPHNPEAYIAKEVLLNKTRIPANSFRVQISSLRNAIKDAQSRAEMPQHNFIQGVGKTSSLLGYRFIPSPWQHVPHPGRPTPEDP